jgi:hypothetical protein
LNAESSFDAVVFYESCFPGFSKPGFFAQQNLVKHFVLNVSNNALVDLMFFLGSTGKESILFVRTISAFFFNIRNALWQNADCLLD